MFEDEHKSLKDISDQVQQMSFLGAFKHGRDQCVKHGYQQVQLIVGGYEFHLTQAKALQLSSPDQLQQHCINALIRISRSAGQPQLEPFRHTDGYRDAINSLLSSSIASLAQDAEIQPVVKVPTVSPEFSLDPFFSPSPKSRFENVIEDICSAGVKFLFEKLGHAAQNGDDDLNVWFSECRKAVTNPAPGIQTNITDQNRSLLIEVAGRLKVGDDVIRAINGARALSDGTAAAVTSRLDQQFDDAIRTERKRGRIVQTKPDSVQ